MAKAKRKAKTRKQVRKPPLNEAGLLNYSEVHLCYEVSMFFESAHYLTMLSKKTDPTQADPQQLITNVFYESFVLHFRNVAEFLLSNKPRPDDIVAIDFLDDPSKWVRPTTSTRFEDHRVRSNKELAHLTAARLPEASKARDWPVQDLVSEMTQLLKDFAALASKKRLHECVSEILKNQDSRTPITPTIPGSGSLTGGTRSIFS
jgi:hypothetical protein